MEGGGRARREQVPQPPSFFNPELQGNAEVEALVSRMLGKAREQRPADANALIQELSLIEAQQSWGKGTIVPPPPPAAQRFPTPPRIPTPPAPAAPPGEKEVEIPIPPARLARLGESTSRPGPSRGLHIALSSPLRPHPVPPLPLPLIPTRPSPP